ncbi:glycosyltransferase [Listeria sp. PSOL-1]|uniref:glycosyltransferase n=1 Tax=Listeria sp. PSOL-1 TaxID=1844999 RepID=UPI0013D0A40C|nr:glycosyltransferase [Listeria sp. PSOL-1]
MKWLFAHDNRFFHNENGEVFAEVAFQYESFKRYLEHADELTILARLEKVSPDMPTDKWNISSGPKVNFVGVADPYGVRCFTPFPKSYQEIKREVAKTDAVIARLPSEIGYMAVDAAKALGKPYAIEVVGDAYEAMNTYGNLKGTLYAPIAKHKMKKRVQDAPHVLYITDQALQKIYPTRGKAISCSNVELPLRESTCEKQRINKIENPSGPIKIGMNGSLSSAYKGFDVAMKALAIAKPELPPFQLMIVGKGPSAEWQALASQLGIEKEVCFVGSMPNKEIYQWLDSIDLFLMPSRTEGQGRALIEALSCGCPALGSNVGGIPELLEEKQLHEPDDSTTLAKKIIEVVTEPSVQLSYAKKAFLTAEKFESLNLQSKRRQFFNQLKLAVKNEIL